jgi:Gas vesicle synthesis protein GvpL/GvpF
MMALSLYGVVAADHSTLWWREAEPALSIVSWEDLAVVVTEVEPDHEFGDEDAIVHLEVLSRLVLDGPVLPLRLGSIAPDPDAVVAEVLVGRADELRDRLAALDGLVEVRVDLGFDMDAGMPAAVAADKHLQEFFSAARTPDRDLALDEKIQLGERVAAEMSRWWSAKSERILAPVAALAERSTEVQAPHEHVRRTAYLVRRDQLDQVDATLIALGEDLPLHATVSAMGPLPAYSFLIDLDKPQAAEAPSRWGW